MPRSRKASFNCKCGGIKRFYSIKKTNDKYGHLSINVVPNMYKEHHIKSCESCEFYTAILKSYNTMMSRFEVHRNELSQELRNFSEIVREQCTSEILSSRLGSFRSEEKSNESGVDTTASEERVPEATSRRNIEDTDSQEPRKKTTCDTADAQSDSRPGTLCNETLEPSYLESVWRKGPSPPRTPRAPPPAWLPPSSSRRAPCIRAKFPRGRRPAALRLPRLGEPAFSLQGSPLAVAAVAAGAAAGAAAAAGAGPAACARIPLPGGRVLAVAPGATALPAARLDPLARRQLRGLLRNVEALLAQQPPPPPRPTA